jgi:hypothetical protein
MKTAVTGNVTSTKTDGTFKKTDMTTGAMLKKTDATLKKTGTETALTGMVIAAIR